MRCDHTARSPPPLHLPLPPRLGPSTAPGPARPGRSVTSGGRAARKRSPGPARSPGGAETSGTGAGPSGAGGDRPVSCGAVGPARGDAGSAEGSGAGDAGRAGPLWRSRDSAPKSGLLSRAFVGKVSSVPSALSKAPRSAALQSECGAVRASG